MAEKFDYREREDLAIRLRELLDACGYVRTSRSYESELSLACSLLYYYLCIFSSSDGGEGYRSAGQDYCGLTPVSPGPDSISSSSHYSPLQATDFMHLHSILSLVEYLRAPAYKTALSRTVLPLLPRVLTVSSCSSGARGLFTALGEAHRVLLLVDGRFLTPLHRLWQVRMTTTDRTAAGQRRTPDRKMVLLLWLLAFKLGVQGLPHVVKTLIWLRTCLFSRSGCGDSTRGHDTSPSEELSERVSEQPKDQDQHRDLLQRPPRPPLSRKCTLCMDFIAAEQAACAPCGHVFCYCCVTRWAEQQPRCPLCRVLVRPQDVRMLYNL